MNNLKSLLKRAKRNGHKFIVFRQIGNKAPTNPVEGAKHEFRCFADTEKEAFRQSMNQYRLHKNLGKDSHFFYRPLIHDGNVTKVNWAG